MLGLDLNHISNRGHWKFKQMLISIVAAEALVLQTPCHQHPQYWLTIWCSGLIGQLLKWTHMVYEFIVRCNDLVIQLTLAIWHHRTWSALVQVMACYLMTTSHYLNQSSMRPCGIPLMVILLEMLKVSVFDMSLEITNWKLQPHIPSGNEARVNSYNINDFRDIHRSPVSPFTNMD